MPGKHFHILRRALLAITAVIWLPAVVFAFAFVVGNAVGCESSEARILPCVLGGIDIGGPLTIMAVTGWVVIAMLPFMAFTLAAWLAIGAG